MPTTKDRATELSELFDVDTDNNLDRESAYDNVIPFEEKIKDVKLMMDQEDDVVEPDEPAKEDEIEEAKVQALVETVENPVSPGLDSEDDNPLQLSGEWLSRYNQLRDKHSQFSLYNGNPIFREFYTYKFKVLFTMVNRFPILVLKDYRDEIRNIPLDHYVGDHAPSPDFIRKKLDDSYRCRIRVGELLSNTYEQMYTWEENLELLESKLWKDHESRGSHKRQALVLEHLHDVTTYVQEVRGFERQAKHVDSLLLAASDSLSRQLTCLQAREPSATARDEDGHVYGRRGLPTTGVHDPDMEGLDTVEEGKVIMDPGRAGVTKVVDMGQFDPDDELMSFGLSNKKEAKNA